jgi:hypothetical protein
MAPRSRHPKNRHPFFDALSSAKAHDSLIILSRSYEKTPIADKRHAPRIDMIGSTDQRPYQDHVTDQHPVPFGARPAPVPVAPSSTQDAASGGVASRNGSLGPRRVVYFGDMDPQGLLIPQEASAPPVCAPRSDPGFAGGVVDRWLTSLSSVGHHMARIRTGLCLPLHGGVITLVKITKNE